VSQEILQLLREHGIKEPTVALLGATYKADVDDVRNTPVRVIAEELRKNGASVVVCDPYLTHFGHEVVVSVGEAGTAVDALIFLVAHSSWRELVLEELRNKARKQFVYDATGSLDMAEWRKAGFHVAGLGRGESDRQPVHDAGR
jgi:UDP-N-acetyl-D-mannosaminuronic acid dehydrogenase